MKSIFFFWSQLANMALWGCAEQRSLCWTVVTMVSPMVCVCRCQYPAGVAFCDTTILHKLWRVNDSKNALQERFRLVTEHHEISMENKQTETSRETSSKKHPRVLPALNLSVKEAGVNLTLLLCLF